PILWNLYFADINCVIPIHANNLIFGSTVICHMKHADDVAMFSTGWRALQEKITPFYEWCRHNFMTMSLLKTEWMVFGGSPGKTVSLMANGVCLKLVDVYKFIGVIFMLGKGNTFRRHYRNKAAEAKAVSVVYFLRRLLGLSHHVPTFALFLETGVMPIVHLQVALDLPNGEYIYLALIDSAWANGDSKGAWFTGLKSVLEALPMPVLLPVWLLDDMRAPGWFPALEKKVRDAAINWIHSEAQKSKKCVLLQKRLCLLRPKGTASRGLQPYLLLGLAAHWVAFTKLMFSDYPLAFEVLRRRTRYRPDGVPREWHLCCFCEEEEVETVEHITFGWRNCWRTFGPSIPLCKSKSAVLVSWMRRMAIGLDACEMGTHMVRKPVVLTISDEIYKLYWASVLEVILSAEHLREEQLDPPTLITGDLSSCSASLDTGKKSKSKLNVSM
ncbi:hypothetical protein CPB85DRAFT_1475006, partial [Mucidula mucida]